MLEVVDSKKIIANEFEKCKENLKLFLKETEKDLSFTKVNYTDWKGFLTHTVTGAEFNTLTSEIQNHLKDFRDSEIKIVKELQGIYNTFVALDNEYLKKIMYSISNSNEAINKANEGLIEAEKRIEDIKETNEKLQIAQNKIEAVNKKLQNTQENIDKTIEFQKRTVESLSQFKNKIDSYRHLKDIDNIWENLQKLEKFKEKLEKNKHLEDIDKIWNDLDYLKLIKSKLETIENLNKLTNDVEELKKLNSSVELSLDFIEENQKKIEDLETNLQATQNVNQSLSKKLNTSYFLGGGALILALFNIFYLFLRG